MQRVVEPEIIDELPPGHPDVIRSRKDLKVINFFTYADILYRNLKFI